MLITNLTNIHRMADELERAARRASAIWISSAYVSPAGCEILRLRDHAARVPVRLTAGRALDEGLPRFTLDYLLALDAIAAARGGGVRAGAPASHAKIYCFEGDAPGPEAWVGSSNLTEHGLRSWPEANVPAAGPSVPAALAEARRAWSTGQPLSAVAVVRLPIRRLGSQDIALSGPGDDAEEPMAIASPLHQFCLPLYGRGGQVQARAGLNWSFGAGRPRDPDEAYIALPKRYVAHISSVLGGNTPGTVFEAVMHDGTQMAMRLEGGGTAGSTTPKQIASDGDKRLFGAWILRRILHVPRGTPVTNADLQRYGRNNIWFKRIGTNAGTGRAVVFIDFRP